MFVFSHVTLQTVNRNSTKSELEQGTQPTFCHWLKLHIMTSRLSLIWPNYHSIGKWTTISHHINVLVFKTTKLSLFYWSTKQIYRCIPRRYRSLTNTIIFPVLWSCWEAHLPAQARGQVRSRHLLRVRGRQESPPVSSDN